jgi:UDP-3-O-[3-hydroxymyristoyl] N-acetylglucosamine deacetylase
MKSSYQHTIKKTCVLEGTSLHSGIYSKVKLHPAPANTGIKFKRIDSDLPLNQRIIDALICNVKSSQLCTSIENEFGLRVSTIEHLMAALHAIGIDNLLIDIDNDEMPILDGSSLQYCLALEKVGLKKLKAKRKFLNILKPIIVKRDDAFIKILPNNQLSIDYTINYPGTAVGNQNIAIESLNEHSFKNLLSDCRTFTFETELEELKTNGIIKGGSLDNAVVFGENEPLNSDGLKFYNEPVRHKALDAIGDLYLTGSHVLAHIEAYCAGHSLTHLAIREIFSDDNNWNLITIDEQSDYKMLPGELSVNSINL